jgi:hypothetical protein
VTRKEIVRQVAVSGVYVDDVEVGFQSALRGVAVPTPEVSNVPLVPGAGLQWPVPSDEYARDTEWRHARDVAAGAHAAVPELDARQRA